MNTIGTNNLSISETKSFRLIDVSLVPKLATNLILEQLWRKVIKPHSRIINVLSRSSALGRRRGKTVGLVAYLLLEKHNQPTGSSCCLLTTSINTNINKIWHLA